MRKFYLLFSTLIFAASHGALAQEPAADMHKKVIFENEYVRVISVTVKPGEKLPPHGHPVHLALVKSGGKLRVTDASGKVANYESKPNDAFWFDCITSHSGENIGKTTMEWTETEFKKLSCK